MYFKSSEVMGNQEPMRGDTVSFAFVPLRPILSERIHGRKMLFSWQVSDLTVDELNPSIPTYSDFSLRLSRFRSLVNGQADCMFNQAMSESDTTLQQLEEF